VLYELIQKSKEAGLITCAPLEYLPGWLFGIDANRVKPELRDGIIRYQRECFRILWQAFQSRAATPDVIPQLVTDQAETRARVNNLEQDVKAIDQSVKEMRVILSEIRGLSQATSTDELMIVEKLNRPSQRTRLLLVRTLTRA
jgi:antirepressor protein